MPRGEPSGLPSRPLGPLATQSLIPTLVPPVPDYPSRSASISNSHPAMRFMRGCVGLCQRLMAACFVLLLGRSMSYDGNRATHETSAGSTAARPWDYEDGRRLVVVSYSLLLAVLPFPYEVGAE